MARSLDPNFSLPNDPTAAGTDSSVPTPGLSVSKGSLLGGGMHRFHAPLATASEGESDPTGSNSVRPNEVAAPQGKPQEPGDGTTRKTARGRRKLRTHTAYHRIGEVRLRQGLSLRTVSRRSGVDMRTLRQEEKESEDLPLSVLYRWQQCLDVPITELLSDTSDPLSPTVRDRAKLVKIMKTVMAINEIRLDTRVRRLVAMLREQLLDLMPELSEIVAWPSFGTRRPSESMGKISESPISLRNLSVDTNEE